MSEKVISAVAGRSCGDCTLCCKLQNVNALGFKTLSTQWCRHCVPGKGCTIYDERPEQCRLFLCLWMLDARLGPEWKPNRAKFVAYIEPNGNRIAIHTDPGFSGRWTQEPYYSQIKSWSAASVAIQKQVVVYAGNRATVILPNKDVELGTVNPDDQLIVGRTSTGDWTAHVVRAKDVPEE